MDDSTNEYPVCVEFDIDQSRVDGIYYSGNLRIDDINRTRQYDLKWERKLQTKGWNIKVNTSILEIYDVDTYYICKAYYWWDDSKPEEFHYNITEEMIENRLTERMKRRNQAGKPIEYPGYIRNIVRHCTPTKKKRKVKSPNGLVDTKLLAKSR